MPIWQGKSRSTALNIFTASPRRGHYHAGREIDSLKNLNNPGKAVLRAEALGGCGPVLPRAALPYGAYYYFGEETFQKAEDAIRAELASYQTIKWDQLISLIYRTCFRSGRTFLDRQAV